MKVWLIVLYAVGTLAEGGGLSMVAWDLRTRYKRLLEVRTPDGYVTLVDPGAGADTLSVQHDLPASSPPADERMARLERQQSEIVSRIDQVRREAINAASVVAVQQAQIAINTSMAEVNRLRAFVGTDDSLRRPIIGLILLVIGLLAGAVASILWVASSSFA